MSAFPFSAPFISKEEEEAELRALTDEENERLQNEIFGPGDYDVPETNEMLKNALALFQEALDSIPYLEKEAYLEAMNCVPRLVETESPSLAFLRHAKLNAWDAARRKVDYWKVRKMLFGPEKAFLAMTLQGAMRPDVSHLENAFFFILPDDDHGRPVFFLDRIRSVPSAIPRDALARCVFYAMQTVAVRESANKKGIVGLINGRGYDIYKHYDRILSKKLLAIINCMPLRINALHYSSSVRSSVLDLALSVWKFMAGKELRLRVRRHAGSDFDILHGLQKFGLHEPHQKILLGSGLHNRSAACAWLAERSSIESGRSSSPPDN